MKKFLLCMSLCAIACCISKLSADDTVVELKADDQIGPHDDSGADFTCSCYLNKEDKNSDKVAKFRMFKATTVQDFKHKLKSRALSDDQKSQLSVSISAKANNVQSALDNNDAALAKGVTDALLRQPYGRCRVLLEAAERIFRCKQHCETYLGDKCFFKIGAI